MMNVVDSLLSLIAPHDCLVCQQEGSLLCNWCSLEHLKPPRSNCYRCRALTSPSLICSHCSPVAGLHQVWVAASYQGAAKQLIGALKFQRAQSAAAIIARAITTALPYLPPELVICPLPTASRRVRQRGYDQAELIAKNVARLSGRRFAHLLNRRGQSRQVGANRQARQRQLAGAYKAAHASLPNQPVLLIDDILTTGASIEAAALALRRAGVQAVSAATFAYKALDR